MVEPHLQSPIVRRRLGLEALAWGAVLLLERHQAGPVTLAIQEVAKAWPGGVGLLRRKAIRSPLGCLNAAHVAMFGEDYQDGFYLRVEAPVPPYVFDKERGGAEFCGEPPPGAWVDCALSLFATIGYDGQPTIGTEIEWIDVRCAVHLDIDRWKPCRLLCE
jgi:hypothetical protein